MCLSNKLYRFTNNNRKNVRFFNVSFIEKYYFCINKHLAYPKKKYMKLRTILKINSFLLLLFSTLVVMRHPLGHFSEGEYSDIAELFGSTEVKGVELFLYLLFAFHMHELDFKFAKAEFGKYFRYDGCIAIINFLILTHTFDNVVGGFFAKIGIEIFAVVTTFFCGFSLCKTLKNHGMKDVGLSYLVLSFRHIVYTVILIVQLFILMFGDSKDVEQFQTNNWILVQWCLLMPILFISRIMLFRGTMKLKVHKHRNREI